MPLVETEFACQTCKQGGTSSRIVANGGSFICSANASHQWGDTPSFMASFPGGRVVMEFKVKPAVFPPQQGYAPLTLSMPIALKEALETRFGGNIGPTVAALCWNIVKGETLVIDEDDLDRFRTVLGSRPTSASELFGMVYALTQQLSDAKQEAANAVQDAKAYEGMSPGRVVVDLGDAFALASENAKNENLPLKVYVQEKLRFAVLNNWF